MKKIICNNKLKKFVITMFMVILLFNYIMPIVVFGATVNGEAKQLMDAWNNNGGTPYMNEATAKNIIKRILAEEYGNDYNENDIYEVININNNKIHISTRIREEQLETIFFENLGERLDWPTAKENFLIKEDRNEDELQEEQENMSEDEKIIIWLMSHYNISRGTALSGLAYIDRDRDITWDDDGNIINIELSEQARNAMQVTAQTPTEQEELREENNLLDTVGGILLEPVFFLVNFVADSIMGLLDGVMENEDLSLLSAIPGLMSSTPEDFSGEPNYTGTISNAIGFNSYPRIRYSPERIFSGKVKLLSIDFISDANATGPLGGVRRTIASWYKALRLFAIIGLLSVLIYTGIKVMLSANTKDKAKYKEWILNWFLAVAILFSMHYIMSFIITVTDEINVLLGDVVSDGIKAEITLGTGQTVKFKTNLIGLCRYMVQADSFVTKIGYEVMYIALIVYTFKFTFVYLKRVLNMAFLTLIAPLVALMYPIDKMTDGSAQGFDMWLKEYIFNALLQPMHMLMYYVLVSSAISVAASNPIYGIVVLMFMTEAEKLFKKIFGFDKAHGGTVGGMGSAFAAGALASQVGNIAKQLKGGNSKGGNSGKGNDGAPELPPTRKDADNVEENFSGNLDDGPNEDSEEPAEDDNPDNPLPPGNEDNDGHEPGRTDENGNPINNEQNDENGGDEETEDGEGSDNSTNPTNPTNPEATNDTSKKNRFALGAKSVGKRLARPIWDFDKSGKYNGKRLVRRLAKGAVGFSVGATAAAVQAGISITDGKYNAFEGIASFGAGWAGGNKVAGGMIDGAKSLKGTFDQGFHSGDDPKQKEEWENKQRARYYEDWSNRDDVNKVFKEKFGEDKFKQMKKNAKQYTDRGYNDPKEVAKLMKASGKLGWDDKKTIATMNFKKQLQDQQAYGAVSDKEKEKKYIDAIIKNNNYTGDKAKEVRKQYEEAFKSVAQLNKNL